MTAGTDRQHGATGSVRVYNLGPEGGSIPSSVTNDCRKSRIYLTAGKTASRRAVNRRHIRSIGLVVAQQPSKLLGPVRVRYAAPAGRIRPFLAIRISPKPQSLADSRQRPRRRVKPWPGGNLKNGGDFVKQSEIPTSYEREMLKRRGLNPADYTVEKRLG